jgi:hypothetical protein
VADQSCIDQLISGPGPSFLYVLKLSERNEISSGKPTDMQPSTVRMHLSHIAHRVACYLLATILRGHALGYFG